MPVPHRHETRNDYVSRAVKQIIAEGHTPKQAVGKAEGMYDYYMGKRHTKKGKK